MEEKFEREPAPVSYFVFEGEQVRHERIVKRLIAVIIICIGLLFASNAFWLYAWMQYDYSGQEINYTQDGRGINIIGNDNEVGDGTESDR